MVPIDYDKRTCPKCLKEKRLIRQKEQFLRKKQKDLEARKQVRIGNINYNPDAKLEPYMTWQEYKELWMETTGHTPRFKEGYLKAKEQWLEDQRKYRVQKSEVEDIVMNIPLNPNRKEGCIRNRRMWLGLIQKDAIDIQNHCSCRWCKVWKRYNKAHLLLGGITGVDLWRSGISHD